MLGDHTLFTSADGTERLREVSAPLLEDTTDRPDHTHANQCGPEATDPLVAPRRWHLPYADRGKRWRARRTGPTTTARGLLGSTRNELAVGLRRAGRVFRLADHRRGHDGRGGTAGARSRGCSRGLAAQERTELADRAHQRRREHHR
jgi:hypothetical protein